MTICVNNRNGITISLNLHIDHNRKEIIFYVVEAIRSDTETGREGKYKEHNFKSFKAAYNKFDSLCDKYKLNHY